MTTTPLDRAKADLALLEDQIALHDDAIRRHESGKNMALKAAEEVRSFIRLYERYAASDPGTIFNETAKTVKEFTLAERVSRIADQQIRATMRRVPTESIYRAVLTSGIHLGGKDENARRNQISGILSRDNRFHGVRRRGWWINSLGACPDDPPLSENAEAADPPSMDLSAASAEPRPTSEGEPVRPVDPRPGGGT